MLGRADVRRGYFHAILQLLLANDSGGVTGSLTKSTAQRRRASLNVYQEGSRKEVRA